MASSVIGSVAGAATSGLISGAFGNDKAEGQFQQGANAAQQIVNPEPFRGNSLFFNTNAKGQSSLNKLGRRQRQQVNTLAGSAFRRFRGFNKGQFASRLLEASDRVNDKREGQAFSSLESKLFNRQGASSGTQRQIADFRSDIEDRRFRRAVDAQFQADQMSRNLLGDFVTGSNLRGDLDDRFRANQQQSLQGAQLLAPFAINNPAQAEAGQFRAQNTQDFFDGLGGVAGGAVNAGISVLGSRGSSGGGNPFNGSGPLQSFGNSPFSSLGIG